MTIEAAAAGDLAAVRDLLARNGLPLDGVDATLTMVVARRDGHVVGAAALELYEDGALLRSVVVDSGHRGARLGHRLTEAAIDLARANGVNAVFLLTTTAERFFPRFGFEQTTRDAVPAAVSTSVEFRSACPQSAVVMKKSLTT